MNLTEGKRIEFNHQGPSMYIKMPFYRYNGNLHTWRDGFHTQGPGVNDIIETNQAQQNSEHILPCVVYTDVMWIWLKFSSIPDQRDVTAWRTMYSERNEVVSNKRTSLYVSGI